MKLGEVGESDAFSAAGPFLGDKINTCMMGLSRMCNFKFQPAVTARNAGGFYKTRIDLHDALTVGLAALGGVTTMVVDGY